LFLGKKAKLECAVENVHREVEEFYELDQTLPEPERFWEDAAVSSFDVSQTYRGFYESEYYARKISAAAPERERVLSLFLANLDKVSRLVSISLGSYDYQDWRFRHGPGAISEVTGPTNKYNWRNWSDRLENVFPLADCGFHNHAAWADRVGKEVDCAVSTLQSVEPYSRLIAVPKDFSKPRLIAAEPSEHMWCQQNVWHYFCERVNDSWLGRSIRFRDQSHNQDLCLRGSLDGSLVTFDLSAASDRVTCHAVGQMFRCNAPLLLALQASRTRFLRQSLTPKVPEVVVLRKFSTMGNACTFPVESLIFFSVTVAAILTARLLDPTVENIKDVATEVAVFGDDIVAPEDSRELIREGLEILDFKVNTAKSCEAGRFRESCGVDAYAGENVTPVYWRTFADGSPESIASVLETCNNFYNKFLLNVAQYLASTLQRDFPVVAMDSGVAGLKSRVIPERPSVKERWNGALQRMESRILTFRSKCSRTPTNDDSAILQYFTEVPDRFVNWSHGVLQRPKLRLGFGWVPTTDLGYKP
jgi:hypothetical protein